MTKNTHTSSMITIGGLLDGSGGIYTMLGGDAGTSVSAVEYNSSRVATGALFVAVEGFSSDGHRFIGDAVERGASAVMISTDRSADTGPLVEAGVTVLGARNTRTALSRVSAEFYGNPSTGIPVVGVTGTNGKTSITYMLESVFSRYGWTPGVIGTVNYRWKGKTVHAPNTTPESRDLQELVAEMVAEGVNCLIMEVSSHGLKLNRVDDIRFNAGIFTNLTRDHMDFHPDFEDYFTSKGRLFEIIDTCPKESRFGIINLDDPYGARLLEGSRAFGYPLYSFGMDANADYRPEPGSIRNTIDGVRYILEKPEKGMTVTLPVAGGFHVSNSLGALAAAHVMGLPADVIAEGLSAVVSIPGRFDRIHSPAGFHVIVDYAHTGDALEKLLQSARDLAAGRIITLFGCGGDRDKTKRPVMGSVASRFSDLVIVTSDNPRTENPEDIISDILPGMEGTAYEVEVDRERAIEKAVDAAGEGDIVVVAGKGHEDYQIIGKVKRHFDDREMVQKYIERRGNR